MIIGDDFLKIAFQIEFIISDYSSPSGMFNFVINEKLIPGESVAIDLYVAIMWCCAGIMPVSRCQKR
ncbi:Uncharacterised protein [Yersinia rohdei]|uniref:hypothetical protein n=1 Tax=Yersinia rohdei TaxID=29485 RepID=UPI00061C6B65|nr:hypothetical protein [Yersinia rohdei]CNF47298.1 Uncharacterised protein [Yersinia rohdei]